MKIMKIMKKNRIKNTYFIRHIILFKLKHFHGLFLAWDVVLNFLGLDDDEKFLFVSLKE
jgi:hypothetical protein